MESRGFADLEQELGLELDEDSAPFRAGEVMQPAAMRRRGKFDLWKHLETFELYEGMVLLVCCAD